MLPVSRKVGYADLHEARIGGGHREGCKEHSINFHLRNSYNFIKVEVADICCPALLPGSIPELEVVSTVEVAQALPVPASN